MSLRSHFLRAGALALTLTLAACFGDSTPQEKLSTIETLQAENLPLNEKQQSELGVLIAKGKAALSAGQEEAAGSAFDGALAILQVAKDAALYNKAD